MTNGLWIASATVLCLQWIFVHWSGIPPSPEWQALSAGVAIFGAAFMLSWAAELAQLDIPQALAIALLALIAVLPEYAVDMYFAWMAGKDPKYTAFAMANMTGANRLLIGVGWAAVVLTFWFKTGKKAIELEPAHKIEIFYLGMATIYSFIISSLPFLFFTCALRRGLGMSSRSLKALAKWLPVGECSRVGL